jgi:hypothetical protein
MDSIVDFDFLIGLAWEGSARTQAVDRSWPHLVPKAA